MPRPPIFNTPVPDEIVTVRFARQTRSVDGEIAFHVRDGSLGTIHSCVATWDPLPLEYGNANQEIFSLRKGEPAPEVFKTSEGCLLEDNSKFVIEPSPEAFDDGVPLPVSFEPIGAEPFADTGEFSLVYDAIDDRSRKNSRFEVRYYFQVVDDYPAEKKRVLVTSGSDAEGEWAAIREVVSEVDSSPSAESNLFLGVVGVSRDPDVKGDGDGSVWVPSGDMVSVAYLNENGEIRATSDTTPPPSPTLAVSPTPTNVPGRYGDPYPTATPTKVPGPPKRNVSAKFARTPARSGETVVFYIRDNHLGTTEQCSVKWVDIPHDVGTADPNDDKLFMPWNVVTGDPVPGAFSREGCDYDGTTLLSVPLHASLNGEEVSPSIEVPGTGGSAHFGLVSIRTEAPKGSTVRIDFHYEVADTFSAQAKLARVYSSSDKDGEWVAIREVTSERDSLPAAASNLYRGVFRISDDPASLSKGDGRVRVRNRSRLSVAYYGSNGETQPMAKASLGLDLPTPTPEASPTFIPSPTPTPIPAVSPWMLATLAILGTLAALRYRRSDKLQDD